MNSRWQASKIGLVNFWYYDEQEFPFVKGRMLLRGSKRFWKIRYNAECSSHFF